MAFITKWDELADASAESAFDDALKPVNGTSYSNLSAAISPPQRPANASTSALPNAPGISLYSGIWEHLNQYQQYLLQIQRQSDGVANAPPSNLQSAPTPSTSPPIAQPMVKQESRGYKRNEVAVKQASKSACTKNEDVVVVKKEPAVKSTAVDRHAVKPKKEFLRRKSKTIKPLKNVRKFEYYSDKFDSNAKPKVVKRASEAIKTERSPLNSSKAVIKRKLSESDSQQSTLEFEKLEAECRAIKASVRNTARKSNSPIKRTPITREIEAAEISKSLEVYTDEEDPEEVKAKVKELDDQIQILKQEQEAVRQQKLYYDKLLNTLQGEFMEFNKQKEQFLTEIEEKQEQVNIYIQEREKWIVNSKKDKEEIKILKQTVETLKRENVRLKEEVKDGRCKSAFGKIKKELEEAVSKNTELQKKIKGITNQKKAQDNAAFKTPKKAVTPCSEIEDRSIKYNKSPYLSLARKNAEQSNKRADKSVALTARKKSPSTKNGLSDSSKKPKRHKHSFDNSAAQRASASKSNSLLETQRNVCEDYEMVFPEEYHSMESVKMVASEVSREGKVTRRFSNGKTEIVFANGIRREAFPDGYSIIYFKNKDIKQAYPNGKMVYYFAEAKITQTTLTDGVQVFKFPANQLEKHYKDGRKEIM